MSYDYTILMDGHWACHTCCSEQSIKEACDCGRVTPWEGVCPDCNKVKRVCQADGCIVTEEPHSNNRNVTVQDGCSGSATVAESATVVDKCGKIEPLAPVFGSGLAVDLTDKINEIVFAVNELAEKMNREV